MNDNKNLKDLVYYDLNIHNLQTTGNNKVLLRFSETREMPIITNGSLYKMSIIRFQLDTNSLPVFTPLIEPFPYTNPNKMIDILTLQYNNTTVQQNLTWTPSNLHLSEPGPLTESKPFMDETNEYYFSYAYSHYMLLLNNTMKSLTNKIKSQLPALFSDLQAPYFIWNAKTDKMELIVQDKYFDQNKINHFKIYFNRALYSNFTTLPAYKNLKQLNKEYLIIIMNEKTTNIIILENDEEYIKITQEYSTVSNISPVGSIVLTSSNLPIQGTEVSNPVIYRDGFSINTNSSNREAIISDFQTNQQGYRPNLIYSSDSEYRWINLTSNSDIKQIDINVYWKNKTTNKLISYDFQSGMTFNAKILFQLK